jgi:hypothetical protein
MITRRYLGAWMRRWWGELLFAAAWIALLMIASWTARTPQLFGGSLCVVLVLGVIHYLDGVRTAARERERDLAAEVALSVSVPRGTAPRVAQELEAFRERVAVAIRAQGAHLREVRRG